MAIFNTGVTSVNISAGTPTATSPAITNTSSTALAANANRKKYLIYNPPASTNSVFIAFSGTASATNGIVLSPGQGWIEETTPLHTGVINAATSTGNATLVVWEWV